MTRFTHTGQDQMIDGCKFIFGIYETDDEYKINKLRKSRLFGKSLFETEKMVVPPTPEPVVEPEKPVKETTEPEKTEPEPKHETDEERFAHLKKLGYVNLIAAEKEEYKALKDKLDK